MKEGNNFAFIDSNNVYLTVARLGWKLDFRRLRVYLKEKYAVQRAFLFIGYLPEYQSLYDSLSRFGYELIFKPTVRDTDGSVKGNCDAELVLHTMINFFKYDRAVIVTGDGDFYCLVKYLMEQDKLLKLLIPNEFRYSKLLKLINDEEHNYLSFLNRFREQLAAEPYQK